MELQRAEEIMVSVLPKELIETAIWYGNRNGRDIDLFLILNQRASYSCFRHEDVDVNYVNKIEAKEMLLNFNPLLTEPVLTGREIYGNSLSPLRKELLKIRANGNTSKYLISQAKSFYEWAELHFLGDEYEKAIITLTFVISFIDFANYYKDHNQVTTLKRLTKDMPNDLLTEAIKLSKNKDRIEKNLTIELLKETARNIDRQ